MPPAQQWGICQWCPTDAPSNSGWRANTPVGIWDINYYRKHVYAGFVRGLGGKLAAINEVEIETPNMDKGAFDIRGNRIPKGVSFNELPSGLYIINGKKVLKR